ncbi:unnamed protein product [Medioppia subpectinata]|uniref:Organic cation transporter n=1 Tax=Medioppia subpectinata TaxID=1979941 RepID=A0A7R9Q3T6_9ACAR|nr:unnamed protein product [Medioppia subpectinata]CAG2111630.1 unnamed protein product [Medioppia subpectinata]
MHTIRRAAKWNGVVLNESHFIHKKLVNESSNSSQNSCDAKHYGPIDILKHKVIRRWSLNLFIIWIIDSLIFYGLSFQASNMGSNTYLTLAAIAAADIPANVIVTLLMQFFGRKTILFGFSLMAGLSCLSTVFIPKSSFLFTVVAIFGKSNISASYTLMYIYSAEIFPTVVRSTGIGLCQMFSRIGGIIAPHLIELYLYYAVVSNQTEHLKINEFTVVSGILNG